MVASEFWQAAWRPCGDWEAARMLPGDRMSAIQRESDEVAAPQCEVGVVVTEL